MTEDKIQKFRELIQQSPASRARKRNELLLMKDEIKEARSRGFTYDQIASFLKQVGLSISRDTIRSFCIDVLKELPVRKYQKKRASKTPFLGSLQKSSGEVPVSPVAMPGKADPNGGLKTNRSSLPPGFRVAGDKF